MLAVVAVGSYCGAQTPAASAAVGQQTVPTGSMPPPPPPAPVAEKAPVQTLEQVKEMLPEVLIRYKGGEIKRDEVWPRIERKVKRQLATGRPVVRGMLTFVVGQAMPMFCDVRLLLPEAAKKGFTPDPDRAAKAVDELEKARGAASFASMLQEEGVTREQFVREFAERAAIKDWVDAEFVKSQTPTDEEMKEFYERNPEESTRPERVHVAQILIRIDAKATAEEKAAAVKKINNIREQLKTGLPFANLAHSESQAPSAVRGGDLGFVSKGRAGGALEETIFALAPGQISDAISTPDGFQLLKCEAHEGPLRPPMAEMKEWLAQRTREDKGSKAFDEYMKKLYADAHVEVLYRKQSSPATK